MTNHKKIMLVAVVLLAILTIGAVSATENLTADVTQDSLELSVDDADVITVVEDDDVGDGNETEGLIDPEMTAKISDAWDYEIGDYLWISVHLPDNATGDLTLLVDGEEEQSSPVVYEDEWGDISRTYGFNYNLDHFGTYGFEVVYSGDETYKSANASFEFELENTRYSFEAHDAYYNWEYANIQVPVNFNGEITVIVNGREYEVYHEYDEDLEEERYFYDVSALDFGENNITIVSDGDDVFGPCECNRTVTVDAYIEVEGESEIFVGEEYVVFLRLPEDATGNLTVYTVRWDDEADENVPDELIATQEMEDGYASISLSDLDAGDYELIAIYEGNYELLKQWFDVHVYHLFNVRDVAYGSEHAIVDVPEGYHGDITVTVNGKDYEVTHEYDEDEYEDYYFFDASILHYGENNVTISADGYDEYDPYECDVTVNLCASIKFPYDEDEYEELSVITYGEDYPISILLPEDATGNLTVYATRWDDETDENVPDEAIVTQEIVDGYASVVLSDVNVGEHTFVAVYEGNYETIARELRLSVFPKFYIPKAIVQGKQYYVTVEGSEDMEGTLTVYSRVFDDDDLDYVETELGSVDVVNGFASFALPELELGEYNILANYVSGDFECGESEHVYCINDTSFEMEIYYGETEVINSEDNSVYVELPDYVTGDISLYIDGELADSKNTEDDQSYYLSFDTLDFDYGTHTLEVRFVSDTEDFENKTSGIKEFEVDSAVVYFPDEIVYNGETDNPHFYAIRVTVNPDATGEITVLVDGEEYEVKEVGDERFYYYTYIRGVPVGSHNITVIYSGDDTYRETSKSQMINISYAINIGAHDIKYGDEDAYIYISVPYDIKDKEFAVTIDGTPYEDFFDFEENSFRVSVPDLTYGNHTVIVKYAGDEIYAAAEFNETFEVSSWIVLPGYWYDGCDVNLILPQDAAGSLIVDVYVEEWDDEAEEDVKVPIDSQEIPLVDGQAHYSLDNFTMGEYYIEARYTGDDYDIEDGDQRFTMRPDVHWDVGLEDEDSVPIGVVPTIYLDTPGWEGRFVISLDLVLDEYWDDEDGVDRLITEKILTQNIPLKYGKANYTFTDLLMGSYHITYAYVVDGEELYESDDYFDVTPLEINIPYDPTDEEPVVVSVVLPEDAVGDLTLGVLVWERGGWIEFDQFNASFEDGVAVVEIELGRGDYRFDINCTTENYGNYFHSYDWIYVDGAEPEGPIDEIEFEAPDSDMTFEIAEQNVAYIWIPENDNQNATLTITGHQASNPEILIVINTSEIEGVYDEQKEAYGYPIALDLSQFDDQAFLEFRIEGLDEDVYWPYVIERGDDFIVFHEHYHDGVIEFNVFYGNLTTGHLNNPELMGPDFHGNLINLGISDSLNITDGRITISDGEKVLFTKLLEDCDKDYQYDILGYNYEVTFDDIEELPENVNLTFTLSAENLSISLKRIRQGDYLYKILTPDDFSINEWSYYNFTVCDEVSDENSSVINILGNSNMQSIYIDFGAGNFNVYVDDVLVDSGAASRLGLASLRNSIDVGGIDLYLSDLGINKSGTYNIRITHYPEMPSEGEYFLIGETEIVNKNITVDLGEAPEPVDPALTVSADDIEVGENATVNIKIDANATGTLRVEVGNGIYAPEIKDGAASVVIADLAVGEYDVVVKFEGNEQFKPANATASFKVSKVELDPAVDPFAPDENATADANTLVYSIEMPEDATGNFTVTLNNKTYTKELVKGKATIEIADLAPGDYNATVEYSGDAKYAPIVKADKSTVKDKKDAGLKVKVNDIYAGENATVSIEIDADATGTLRVEVGNGIYTPEIKDGAASVVLANFAVGEYDVVVKFEGDKQFKPANATATFKVSKKELDPTVDPFAPAENTTDSNNPVYSISLPSDATGNLTVTVANKTYTAPVVNGKASIEVTDLPAGTYDAVVAYSGDANYAPITKNDKATVKVNPKIDAADTTVQYSDGKIFQVTVYGDDGKVAANTPVVFKVDGVAFANANTDANGVAYFGTSQLPGTYTVTAEALGANATAKLVVKQILKVKKVNVKKSAKKLVLTASLKKVNGKYLAGKKIKFKFNGKKFNAKTNKKGVAKVTIKSKYLKKLKVGKKVKYQATYLKDTVKVSVKVKK